MILYQTSLLTSQKITKGTKENDNQYYYQFFVNLNLNGFSQMDKYSNDSPNDASFRVINPLHVNLNIPM